MAQGTSHRSLSHSTSRNTPTVYGAFVSGATGAVPAMSSASMQRSKGIVSITRNSAGNYTVVLARGANDINRFVCNIEQAASTPVLSGACWGMLWKNDSDASTPSFTFQVCTGPGVAVDPTTGDRVLFSFEPKYSTGLT